MEQLTDAMGMLDLMARPAFCVRDGHIVKVNPAAQGRMIAEGSEIFPLLETGREEYEAFNGGYLYLNLKLSGTVCGASVTRMKDFDVFCLEQEAESGELQALALAAQELRGPLTNIMITADQLFPAAELGDNPATREQVARINRGLFQMLRVISNMSDASRYAADTASRQETQNISALLEEIFSKAAALVEQTGISLTYTGISEDIYCLADAEKLERAILNIISNAIKFTPKDGRIDAKLVRRDKKLYLTICDSGEGIPGQVQNSVFTRYLRSPALEDGRFGIGLGMVLVRSAAAVHGGTVLIDQPEGTGTRITMSIAIRHNSGTRLRSNIFRVDYAGERDHGLIELSDSLPASLYEQEN